MIYASTLYYLQVKLFYDIVIKQPNIKETQSASPA
jgi:hypothetical protein